MRSNPSIVATFVLLAQCAGVLKADERNDAEDLEMLQEQVRRVLPKGWAAALELVDADRPDRKGDVPSLVIRSEKPLELELVFPSAGPGQAPTIMNEEVVLRLVAMPFVTLEKYQAIKKRNAELEVVREKFTRTEMSAIQWAHKGALPLPPEAFRPETDPEQRLVRQYAYLWLRTQPAPLPTHHTGTLSFSLERRWLMVIRDQAKAKEYEQILEALKKLAVPYEPEEE